MERRASQRLPCGGLMPAATASAQVPSCLAIRVPIAANIPYYTITIHTLRTCGRRQGAAGPLDQVPRPAGAAKTCNNFDDYLVPTNCTPSYSYTVTNCGGAVSTPTSLGGNTQQGDTVSVSLKNTMSTSETFTLVSYIAPSSSWNAATAYQQQIYQEQTITLAAGASGTLMVQIPNCYYQIDFVCGPAINVLMPRPTTAVRTDRTAATSGITARTAISTTTTAARRPIAPRRWPVATSGRRPSGPLRTART